MIYPVKPRRVDIREGQFPVNSYRTARNTYIVLIVPKVFGLERYPAESMDVPERFPPLADRIKAWTSQKIIEELQLHSLRDGMTELEIVNETQVRKLRDSILARELVRRHLSKIEFRQVMMLQPLPGESEIKAVPFTERSYRAGILIAEIYRANKEKEYGREVQKTFEDYTRMGSEADVVVKGMIRQLALFRFDMSESVLKVMKSGRFQEEGLDYLKFRGCTKQTHDELQSLDLPSSLEEKKQYALDHIGPGNEGCQSK